MDEIEHSNNMIYIPRVGVSDVVENPSDFKIKPHNYIQVILDNQISATYLVKYFNTSLGKLTRESRMVGTVIQNITLSSLEDAPLFIPDYQQQISLIDVNNKIELIDFLHNFPNCIQRPIFFDGTKYIICRPPNKILSYILE